MSTERCCSRSVMYNIRRYDPIGRTMWVRDYFANAAGQQTDPFAGPCRLCVDSENDLIFVSGPLAYERWDRPQTWWNLACYTTGGSLLWRKRFGRNDNSGGSLDVIMVNGSYYAIVEEWMSPQGVELDALSIVEFNRQGQTVHIGTTDHIPVLSSSKMGPRLLAGKADEFYDLPHFDGMDSGPAGIVTYGWPEAGVAQSAAYFPENDEFVVAIPPPDTGAVFPIVWSVPSGLAVQRRGLITVLFASNDGWPGEGIDGEDWPPSGIGWEVDNNPGDLFGMPSRVWIIPNEMWAGPSHHVFCAAANDTYYLFDGLGNPGIPLGKGSLVRLDDDGAPVWMRGVTGMRCLAGDLSGRLYSGAIVKTLEHPSVMRWTQDGEFIWGHSHNAINQVALVDDRGIVTVGVRQEYGRNEVNWVVEGSE